MADLITTDYRRALIGIGVTGLSVARHLSNANKEFDVFDTRKNPPGLEGFRTEFPHLTLEQIHLGAISSSTLSTYREVILSPGIDSQESWLKELAETDTEIIGDIELFARQAQAPVVAITGSNAKSTVTTLLGMMAEADGKNVGVGGNLGTAALDLLDSERDLYLLELSSFQLELVSNSLKSAAACILNVSPDHMDRYPSMVAYHAAKQRIYMGAERIVFNYEDPLTQPLLQTGQSALSFRTTKPDLEQYGLDRIDGELCLVKGHRKIIAANELGLKGRHNMANVLAAFALGEIVGLSIDAMKAAAVSFKGLPHRSQTVAESAGVLWVDDSKATNLGAVAAALSGLGSELELGPESGSEKNIILIAGGQAKGQDFDDLAPLVGKHVKQLILIGQDADKLRADLAGSADSVLAVDMRSAVETAAKIATEGDTVLLSPGCASFDMFSGFEERGQIFVESVEALL